MGRWHRRKETEESGHENRRKMSTAACKHQGLGRAGKTRVGGTQQRQTGFGWTVAGDSLTFHLSLQLGVYLSNLLITLSRLENRNKTLKRWSGVKVVRE